MKKVPSSGDIFLARAIAGIVFLIEVSTFVLLVML